MNIVTKKMRLFDSLSFLWFESVVSFLKSSVVSLPSRFILLRNIFSQEALWNSEKNENLIGVGTLGETSEASEDDINLNFNFSSKYRIELEEMALYELIQ